MAVRIIQADCRDVLRTMADESVHCCVTSPPYFVLRDYGVAGQIGREPSPEAFVAEMVAVFREVRRVLRDDGTLWLNLGDSYAGSNTIGSRSVDGLKAKDLIGIPWRVAFALQADGWYLRQDIIWHKPNPMPESVTDRCTKAHEYVFLLSKSARYYFDAGAIKESVAPSQIGRVREDVIGGTSHVERGQHSKGGAYRTAGNKSHKYVDAYATSETEEHRTKAGLMAVADVAYETRNKRSVWTIATQPFKEAHFATFPPALIEPCILAGCPEGGTVLDPFGGAGTTGLVADRLKRNAILIELNPEYAAMARQRIMRDAPLLTEVA